MGELTERMARAFKAAMSANSKTHLPSHPHLRPFDVGRDLNAVARLVEACFADTLDADGRRYVQQMHDAARNPRYLRWAASVADHVPMPLTGYIWEEGGRLVGNLNLIPFSNRGKRGYLIANVAVDPAYRRRGIARALTHAALEHARKRAAATVWLHVREENLPALALYLSIGFREHARRTTWEGSALQGEAQAAPDLPGVTLVPGQARFWSQQRQWLQRLYPPELTWHLPFHLNALRPGLLGGLYRLANAIRVRLWAALCQDRLLGVLAWQLHPGHADQLWLATSAANEETAIAALLPQARRRLSGRTRLVLEYPAGHGLQAFRQAGFHAQQTLIWMVVRLGS